MKPRILNYGISATHDSLTVLSDLGDPVSITDFDAFVIDPERFKAGALSEVNRRQRELRDLICKKGGLILCILRPHDFGASLGSGFFMNYTLFEQIDSPILSFVKSTLRAGAGSDLRFLQRSSGPSSAYFQVLKGHLTFKAFLETNESTVKANQGSVLAINSVGDPIAVEFRIGQGVLSFVLPAYDVPGERVGAAIVGTVRKHFEHQADVEMPSWADHIVVPGASIHDMTITELTEKRDDLNDEIADLQEQRNKLLDIKRLLYGYGKAVLENEVRAAFRLLDFVVKDPEDYAGEWDVDLSEPKTGNRAIGEVEGSEGPVDVDKYRQLLDYTEAEVLEGRDPKGILIGNGFRLMPLESAERQRQFSEHVLRGAAKHHFCLLPTTELFKAVSAILEVPENQDLKNEIRTSILNCTGVWSFAK